MNSQLTNDMVLRMPQRKPIFFQNGYFHVYNRGHNKQKIFLHYKDYVRYLLRLKEYLEKHPITLLCYCLMPNHIHLILRQDSEEPIDVFIHRLHTAYTMFFNKKYERVGSVFQSRFKAKCIETDEYLLHGSRYVHINPIELLRPQGPALNSQLTKYPWSSYQEYTQPSSSLPISLCDTSIILNYFKKENKQQSYKQFVGNMIRNVSDDHLSDISSGTL